MTAKNTLLELSIVFVISYSQKPGFEYPITLTEPFDTTIYDSQGTRSFNQVKTNE